MSVCPRTKTIAAGLVTVSAAALLLDVGPPSVATVGPPGNWALDRIDQRQLPLDGRPFTPAATGRGVTIYVIDSGVRIDHPDFGGRARPVGNFFEPSRAPGGAAAGRRADAAADVADCAAPDGHGTLTASLAAGTTFGVASGAHLLVLRASGGPTCAGSPEAARRAVDWVTEHGQKPAVVNISFRFADAALNAAIHRSIAAGFVYTLSAGTAGDVTRYWGRSLPGEALIAAGVDALDTAIRDDYGPALSLFAPAVAVTGAGLRDDGQGWTPARDQSGDSYAAPLVAGVAAVHLEQHPQASPREVRDAIITAATRDAVRNPGQSPNRLLHVVQ